jgi:hypothetical protein
MPVAWRPGWSHKALKRRQSWRGWAVPGHGSRGGRHCSRPRTKEVQIAGFNVVTLASNGRRTQVNAGLIPCAECSTGRGHTYTYFVPKHKGGQSFFVEMVFADGRAVSFGPAVKR